MTVAQLIEKLKQMPQDLEVKYDGDEGFDSIEDARLSDWPRNAPVVLIG